MKHMMNRTETREIKTAKQVLAVILLLCILAPLLRLLSGGALAEGTPTDIQPAPAYKISFTLPAGWSRAASAPVKVKVTDLNGTGWRKAEWRMNGGHWLDISDRLLQAENGTVSIEVTENGKLSVRVTDPLGNTHVEETTVRCFDREAPVVTAQVDDVLRVQAEDELSGVAGVQVCGLLFTAAEYGALNIHMGEALNRYEKLAIRAFDFAGNFSEVISLENPYYTAPAVEPTAVPTDAPTATPKPDKGSSGGSGGKATASPVPTAAATAAPLPASPVADPAPTATPITVTEYVPLGPGQPYLANGNAHTLDMLYSAATNKQFITVQTKNGETFYLIIDYDKPIDEAAELYETYFLNLVDERDLLALLSDEEKETIPTPTPEVIYVTPEPTRIPAVTDAPGAAAASDHTPMTLLTVALLVAVAAGGGAFAFMRTRNKRQKKPDFEEEYGFEEEDEEDSADDE